MGFSKLKYLALGAFLASGMASAEALKERPYIGKASKKAETMEVGSCHTIPIYITHLILERTDDSGKRIGYSYHLVKRENEGGIVDLTIRRWISENNMDELLNNFEANPFAFSTKDKIYNNWMSRTNSTFSEVNAYDEKRNVCKDINKIMREERLREIKSDKKEIS